MSQQVCDLSGHEPRSFAMAVMSQEVLDRNVFAAVCGEAVMSQEV
jgi:hypothetical protein